MSDEAAPGPSARSVQRLATDVGNEVADLRTRLHRALDEAGRLEAEGRQDLAAAVLEEQREALLSVHHRLQGRLADAAVEREAERVVAEGAPATGPRGASTAVRVLGAVAAAVVGVALLVTPELGSAALTVAGLTSAADPEPHEAAVSGRSDQSSALAASSTAQQDPVAGPGVHAPAASAATAPVRSRVDGDRTDGGQPPAPGLPLVPGADEVADVTGLAGLVQQWLDGWTAAKGVSPDEGDAGDVGQEQDLRESPSVQPAEQSDEAGPDAAEPDDDRILDGR